MPTVGSLAFQIAADTSKFTQGVVGTKAELRELKSAFLAGQEPVDKYSSAIAHLEGLAARFPEKAAGIAPTISKMRTEMQQAEFSASKFGQVWNKVGFNVDPVNLAFKAASTVAHTVEGAVGGVVNRIEDLNKLGHQADLLGVPLKSMIGLSEAAERLSGTDLPTFETAFQKVAANVAGAAMGTNSEAASVLDRLGLDPEKLSGMRSDEQFLQIADAMQKVENAGERLALSKTLLGKGGAELATTLAAGGDAIRRIADEEIKASQIDFVDREHITQAHQAFDDFGDTLKGISNVAASEFAPVFSDVSHMLTDALGGANKDGAELRGTIHGLATATRNWFEGLQMVSESGVWGTLAKYSGAGWLASNLAAPSRGTLEGPTDKYAELRHGLADKQTPAQVKESEEAARKASDFTAMEIKAELDLANAVEYANKKIEKQRNMLAGQEIDRMAKEVDELMQKAKSWTDKLATPSEKARENLAELQKLNAAGELTPQMYKRGLEELRDKAEEGAKITSGKSTVSAIHGGSVEALRAESGSKTVSDKQLREAEKQTREAEKQRGVMERIEKLLTAPQLKEAV